MRPVKARVSLPSRLGAKHVWFVSDAQPSAREEESHPGGELFVRAWGAGKKKKCKANGRDIIPKWRAATRKKQKRAVKDVENRAGSFGQSWDDP